MFVCPARSVHCGPNSAHQPIRESLLFFSARQGLLRQLILPGQVTRIALAPLRAVSERSSIDRETGARTDRELFELVYRRMRALARGGADLDDLVQLAAEQVFRSLPSFDGRSELETWVFGVCYRVLMSQRRWYWRFRQRFTSDSVTIESCEDDGAASAHELLEAEQRLTLLRRALDRMSDKYRIVLVLYYLEGIDSAEIARVVSCKELTVRSRLRDGRKQLLKLLGRDAREIFVGAST
jgi:RNA polymerase sigma-70 factor, ECF subfamily